MSKSLVVYYTWSGRTRKMAEIISEQTGADVIEILPETPYTQNYGAVVKQAKQEIQKGYNPPLQNETYDLSEYDVVFVGIPIWWGTMAPPVATFLNSYDWNGKTIMPFSTHGGGGKGHCDNDIAKMCTGAKVMEMYTAYEGGGLSAKKEITAWIQKNS